MRSFLKEIEDKFMELEDYCDACDRVKSQCICDEEIDEQNVTGAVAGFNTPAPFAKPGKWKGKEAHYESVNTSAAYKHGDHQRPESHEEELADKFVFSGETQKWYNEKYEYPSKHMPDKPTKHSADHTKKHASKVESMMERKYIELIESYRTFATGDSKTTPEQKVKNTIKEVAKKLQEIETLINHTSKLKTEAGLSRTGIGPAADKALTKISERLTKIAERVRSLGE